MDRYRSKFGSYVICLAALLSFLNFTTALQIFNKNSLPKNITTLCAGVLLDEIACSPVITALRSDTYYQQSTLEKTCKPECSKSLDTFWGRATFACGNQSWQGPDTEPEPITTIVDLLRYHYGMVCLMDAGRYCNIVAAANAVANDDRAISPVRENLQFVMASVADPCDMCFVKKLKSEAESPYYFGPKLVQESVYESKTMSCKITGLPLATTKIPVASSTVPSMPTASNCVGKSYQIIKGQSCHAISLAQGISTGWLLLDNNLGASCSGMPSTGSLCLIHTCKIYTVKLGDTCESVSAAHGINTVQLRMWNPAINNKCNLERNIDDQICIGQPGDAYNPTNRTITTPTTTNAPAAIPKNVAKDSALRCGSWFEPISGQDCSTILMKFGLSITDFLTLNPSINEKCTNMWAKTSYCVQAVGDINTYKGRDGDGLLGLQMTYLEGMKPMAFSLVTKTTIPTASAQLVMAPGTRADCDEFIDGTDFQLSPSQKIWKSTCEFAMTAYRLDLAIFQYSTLANCTLKPGVQYCVRLGAQNEKQPERISNLPIREATTKDCTKYFDVPADSSANCETILRNNQLTLLQFFDYNPLVKSDCSGLWLGYQYCARTPRYVAPLDAEDTASPSSISLSPSNVLPTTRPLQTQPGIIASCTKFAMASAGGNCYDFSMTNKITPEQLYSWNSQLGPGGSQCSLQFWPQYSYCVGVSSPTSKAPATRPSKTVPTSLPMKTQPDSATPGCKRWDIVKPGDGCEKMANRNGISPQKLYEWNKVLGLGGRDCSTALWLDYSYCVAA